MKQVLSLFLIFVLAIGGTFAVSKILPWQQDKTGTLTLTKSDAETLYQIIDDAAVPGTVRRPLLQKISVMYQATWITPPPVPKVDTPSNKNKKP